MPATKSNLLLTMARKGPVRARDLDEAAIPRAYLRRLSDRGLLEQVDRGLYRLADAVVTEHHSLVEASKRVPHGIVCLLSALQFHELTTEVPHAVWLMIDAHARLPTVRYPTLEIVRASGAARTEGVETRRLEGVEVHITMPAKTVADCFRFRRHVGLEVALDALREYLKKRQRSRSSRGNQAKYTIEALMAAARADRITTVLRPYLEALA
jgi:predicted transcriptional regulator of viral defense system